jgi:drug/metabolite transporter (DMT)-like permease
VALLPTAAAFALWYKAAQMADASQLGPLQYVAPVVSTLLGWALLGEQIGLAFVVGTALVLVALRLATAEER